MQLITRTIIPLLLLALATSFQSAHALTQVFMIQNSGWMEPFYLDQNSPFKPLIGAMIETFADPGDNVALVAFSQNAPANPSPRLLAAQQRAAINYRQILDDLTIASRGRGMPLADTDFREAISDTIKGLQGQQAVLWILTNNRNSPNNDTNTSRRNKEFYDLLHNAEAITRTLAYPLPLPQPLRGPHYTAEGMMVYALAYGSAADAKLQEMVNTGRIAKVFPAPPLRLKPLDSNPVAFTTEGAAKSATSKASIHIRDNRLHVEFDVDDKAPTLALRIGMQNIFNPYRIDQARVSASFAASAAHPATQQPLQVMPTTVEGLDAGKSVSLDITIPIPIDRIPNLWTFENIKKAGTPTTFSSAMTLTLSGMRLSMPEEFERNFATVFPADPKPEMLRPPSREFSSSVTVPVVIRVNYPTYPIYIIGLGFIAGIGGLLYMLAAGQKPRQARLLVDGQEQYVTLKPFSSMEIRLQDTVVGSVRRGLGAITVSQQSEGHTLSILS